MLRRCGNITHRCGDEDEVADAPNGAMMSAEAHAGICPRCRRSPPAVSVTLFSRRVGVGFGVKKSSPLTQLDAPAIGTSIREQGRVRY